MHTTYKGMLDSVHCTKSTFCKRLIHIFSKYFVQCDIFKHLHMCRILCKVIFQWKIYSISKFLKTASSYTLPKYTWANRILPHYISRLQYVPYRWKCSAALKIHVIKMVMSHNIQEVKFSRITHFVLCTYMCIVCDVHQGTCQFVCSLGTCHHVAT